MKPGEYFLAKDDIELNAGKEITTVSVTNSGDRPVQVGSHCHFFEVNKALRFARPDAYGKRLNIASGTAVRFEAGQTQTVELVPFGGRGFVSGFNALVHGQLNDPKIKAAALKKAEEFCASK
jgi:urease beta subunit